MSQRGDTRTVFFLEKEIDSSIKHSNFETENKMPGTDSVELNYKDTKNPNKVDFFIKAPADGFLVRLENYHSGWQAFIDGEKTRLYKANYAFQAIKVPRGEHKISFQFRTIYPLLFYCHIGIVILVWLLCYLTCT